MSNELAVSVAKSILEDRRGAGYYTDVKILADFLKGHCDAPIAEVEEAAQAILKDRQGADYYKNPEILAGYLQRQLG